MNLRNLERMLAKEEEVKKRAIMHKAVYNGPQVHYSSKNGKYFYPVSFCRCSSTMWHNFGFSLGLYFFSFRHELAYIGISEYLILRRSTASWMFSQCLDLVSENFRHTITRIQQGGNISVRSLYYTYSM